MKKERTPRFTAWICFRPHQIITKIRIFLIDFDLLELAQRQSTEDLITIMEQNVDVINLNNIKMQKKTSQRWKGRNVVRRNQERTGARNAIYNCWKKKLRFKYSMFLKTQYEPIKELNILI